LTVHETRLMTVMSEPGVTGHTFLPRELQRLIFDFLTGGLS
jgi:hypothetical protein